MKLWSYCRDGKFLYHARKGDCLGQARNYSSQVNHLVQIAVHIILDATKGEMVAAAANHAFESTAIYGAFRHGKVVPSWEEDE